MLRQEPPHHPIQEHPHDQAQLPRIGEVAQTVVREGVRTIGGEGMQIAVGEGEEVWTIVEEGEEERRHEVIGVGALLEIQSKKPTDHRILDA